MAMTLLEPAKERNAQRSDFAISMMDRFTPMSVRSHERVDQRTYSVGLHALACSLFVLRAQRRASPEWRADKTRQVRTHYGRCNGTRTRSVIET